MQRRERGSHAKDSHPTGSTEDQGKGLQSLHHALPASVLQVALHLYRSHCQGGCPKVVFAKSPSFGWWQRTTFCQSIPSLPA